MISKGAEQTLILSTREQTKTLLDLTNLLVWYIHDCGHSDTYEHLQEYLSLWESFQEDLLVIPYITFQHIVGLLVKSLDFYESGTIKRPDFIPQVISNGLKLFLLFMDMQIVHPFIDQIGVFPQGIQTSLADDFRLHVQSQ
jgi:hypothetical protein